MVLLRKTWGFGPFNLTVSPKGVGVSVGNKYGRVQTQPNRFARRIAVTASAVAATLMVGLNWPSMAASPGSIAESTNSTWQRQEILQHTRWLLRDLRQTHADFIRGEDFLLTVDLSWLPEDFDRFLSDGCPPKTTCSAYKGWLGTAKRWARHGGNHPGSTLADYTLVVINSRKVVKAINHAYGTNFKLPQF